MNFKIIFFKFYEEYHWNYSGDCIEYVYYSK
jgi:hypothetical protein